jgi:predicted peptidase
MKRRSLLACAILLVLAACSRAQPGPEPGWHSVPASEYRARDQAIEGLRKHALANVEEFEPALYRGTEGRLMPYRLFRPELKRGEKYPLVLVLHGAGNRGMDNVSQISVRGSVLTAGIWALAENQKAHPCFVLAPQCPPEPAAWSPSPGWDETAHPFAPKPAPAGEMVMAILAQVCQAEAVDLARVYVVGVSMGGYGTWDFLARWPERFAAGVPVCGGMADDVAARFAQVRVLIFHGDADDVVSVSDSRRAFRQLRAAGATPKYTEYQGGGHQISGYAWTEPGALEWLFAQRRR